MQKGYIAYVLCPKPGYKTKTVTLVDVLMLCLKSVFSLSLSQKQQSVSVLGMKRSNIITIALSSLPPPRLLPPTIYSMDSSVLDREDVQVQHRSHPPPFICFTFSVLMSTFLKTASSGHNPNRRGDLFN